VYRGCRGSESNERREDELFLLGSKECIEYLHRVPFHVINPQTLKLKYGNAEESEEPFNWIYSNKSDVTLR